jgi:hypothetical protein
MEIGSARASPCVCGANDSRMSLPTAGTTADAASRIRVVRGHKVLLDSDLAELYGVSTKRLNEVVKRNSDRFDDDFAFRLGRAALDADMRRRFDEVHAAFGR